MGGEPPSRLPVECVRTRLVLEGIVQGVGFRPFVYGLAGECGLTGSIGNTTDGVAVEVQGSADAVAEFVSRLQAEAPALARILAVRRSEVPVEEDDGFRILPSAEGEKRRALVLPDVALCSDCLRELFDPGDRRFRFPFIGCTNCGPRYTITYDIPYDRKRTSMRAFPHCEACSREYTDPTDRRFHAQADSCPACGPRLRILGADGRSIETEDPVGAAAAHLASGSIVAVKGIGGFHLAADATDPGAVVKLRGRKGRVAKPFAVMVRDVEAATRIVEIGDAERDALGSPEHPIVLLPKRPGARVADAVAPGNADLGLFLPYTPLHRLLFDAGDFDALVMTSGNLSEEPIAAGNDEALRRLRGLADLWLLHDRDIHARCDDSVVRVVGGRTRLLRRARGHVPAPVLLRKDTPAILAVGGHLKNTVCFTRGRYAFPSQHIGDLENTESLAFFEETIAHLKRMLGVEPAVVAHDLHPGYLSTRWALEQPDVEHIAVQHHHAHIAACMAEHRLEGRVIGLALDGTGYGTDGTVWGGEVLLADAAGFERFAHLETVPMPGGEAAIHEPWRMALAWLWTHRGEESLDLPVPFVRSLDITRARVLIRMIVGGVNAPETSSCGRLFDAVAALAGVRSRVSYEAQAAIELEMAMRAEPGEGAYPFEWVEGGDGASIGTEPLLAELLEDLRRGVPTGVISGRFHRGLADVLLHASLVARDQSGLERVCLSGGTFQNVFLHERLAHLLRGHGFDVFTHAQVPANDGGLSLGQAAAAAALSSAGGGSRGAPV